MEAGLIASLPRFCYIELQFRLDNFAGPGSKANTWRLKNISCNRNELACVAGARKGKGDRARVMLGGGGGGGTEAPAAKPLFISSFSFAGERKIAIGSFLIMLLKLINNSYV